MQKRELLCATGWIVFYGTLEALHILHSLGIVHMDIKLENLLMEVRSNTLQLCLQDAGVVASDQE